MKLLTSGVVGALFLVATYSASAQLRLRTPAFSTEAEAIRVFNNMSFENALTRLGQIKGFLESFRTLTEQSRDLFTQEELSRIGNTGLEMQSLGFHNIPRAVEAALRKQAYLLKQLEYELADYKYKAGEVDADELNARRIAYEQSETEFQMFWDALYFVD